VSCSSEMLLHAVTAMVIVFALATLTRSTG
jgi:hypothetical protein